MENISPSLILLWDIKRSLEKGQALQTGVRIFLNRKLKNSFSIEVERWWLSQNNALLVYDKRHLSPTRKYLFEIFELGLAGQSILEILKSYEVELIQKCEDEIQDHIAQLPLLLMIPLMGLIFPAMLMLLIGPLLASLQF
jgi:hypothetical protein